jgi:hypothetical protein
MVKKYERVPNFKRRLLIKYIYEQNMTIVRAAQLAEVYYPTAKAINKVYIAEQRTDKKVQRASRTSKALARKHAELEQQKSTNYFKQ